MLKQEWELYKKRELKKAQIIAAKLGFSLNSSQPHIQGERYLMSGPKLVLLGKQKNKQIVIKISSQKQGKKEIVHEHQRWQKLNNINFAYYSFYLPKEILFTQLNSATILITEFINQKKPFLAYSLKEQFFLALRAFSAQEGAHAITSSHFKEIKKIFKRVTADNYQQNFANFKKNIINIQPKLMPLLSLGQKFLTANYHLIEIYSDFLTHSDFVPHNIRIANNKLYLLDYPSLHFGNKYEGWARFINYLTLHNQELANALTNYILKNRPAEEYLSLRLMRIYKLGFLLQFYAQTLAKTTGNLHQLTQKRIEFWTQVLADILADKPTKTNIIKSYQQTRDRLRSQEEKIRQKNL